MKAEGDIDLGAGGTKLAPPPGGGEPSRFPTGTSDLAGTAKTPETLVAHDVVVDEVVSSGVLCGTGMLAAGMAVERGAAFLGNVLAARLAGAEVFGAYALGIATANQIGAYAAGQIAATAVRFSGKYPWSRRGYGTLARALLVVSIASAVAAGAVLWFGAPLLARLQLKPEMGGLLRWAALSAAGVIVFECARGFFVGQRRLRGLLLLSGIFGGGMLLILPWVARTHQASHMVLLQGSLCVGAVAVCGMLATPLRLRSPVGAGEPVPLRPVLGEVASFGSVQLGGLVLTSLAGWWVTTLVARADSSLVEMSFFTIGSQLRNIAGIVPGMLTEGSYAAMADPEAEAAGTPERLMALCTYVSTVAAMAFAGVSLVLLPWGLRLLYGPAYRGAALAVAVGLVVPVVHMGGAPAAARLSVVSLRWSGWIQAGWAVLVGCLASVWFVKGVPAWGAFGIYFVAHVSSAVLVLLALRRNGALPAGLFAVLGVSAGSVAALVGMAAMRVLGIGSAGAVTAGMVGVLAASVGLMYMVGRRYCWLGALLALFAMVVQARGALWRSSEEA